MGKLSKYRRTQLRKHRAEIEQLKAQLGVADTQKAMLRRSVKEASDEQRAAVARLQNIEGRLRRMCAASTLFAVSKNIPSLNPRMQVPVPNDPETYASVLYDVERSFRAMSIEGLMQVLQYEVPMADSFARRMHFRVLNAPGGKDFTYGYAVTHREVEMTRFDQNYFVRFIAENIGAGIWQSLYGEKKEGT